MQTKHPSLTAQGAAAHRAVHQIREGGAIFTDPFARTILGEEACTAADAEAVDPATRPFRLFMAARSRFAEDALAASVARGVRQVVVLGAGFDTFALRNPFSDLRVFEVDHPATQAWKRERLAQMGVAPPVTLTFVSIDFEREDLAERLRGNGFRLDLSAFFIWLGVVPYLRREAIAAVLRVVAALPNSEVVFDYTEPLENYPPERRSHHAALAERVAAIGEPFLSHFEPGEVMRELHALGFAECEDLNIAAIAARFFGTPPGKTISGGGPHIIRAHK